MSFEQLPTDWAAALQNVGLDIATLYAEVDGLCGRHSHVYPARTDVFRAFHATPLSTVRLVILGQDPYPAAHPQPTTSRPGVADGLAFSSTGLEPQLSLHMILANLWKSGLVATYPADGSLDSWASQGVLLLNTALTVDGLRSTSQGAQAVSLREHQRVYRSLLRSVVKLLEGSTARVVYLPLGAEARKFTIEVSSSEPTRVVESSHPSRVPWPAKGYDPLPFQTTTQRVGPPTIGW